MLTKLKKLSLTKVFTILYTFYIKQKFHSCGKNCRIHFPVMLHNPHKIRIGNNVSIGCHCWLNCIEDPKKNEIAFKIGNGCQIGRFAHINAYREVELEDYVLIAERVHISDATHHYQDSKVPIIAQGAGFVGAVKIKCGAWIGSGAVILPGVTIGRNAVVGANAVVTKDVPDNHVAVGVPAKIFSMKKKDKGSSE